MGPLAFSPGSHLHDFGRDLKISDESEEQISQKLRDAGNGDVVKAFKLGDISFHSGWTFHHAGPNRVSPDYMNSNKNSKQ